MRKEKDLDPHAIAGPNVPRNSLTIINVGLYQKSFFFDGRLQRLGALGMRSPESMRDAGRDLTAVQARFPVVAEDEMRGYRMLRHAEPGRMCGRLGCTLKTALASGFRHRF